MQDVARASVSLFSGGGFGDIGVECGARVPVIACCEVVSERADVLKRLFPDAVVFQDDIWQCRDAIVHEVRRRLDGKRPWLLVMSPPCQGMSSNGAGRITSAIKKGQRPTTDARNQLILPALDVAIALQPEWIIIENVKHMQHTLISNEEGRAETIIDLVRRRLGTYRVAPSVVNAADYGVPQRRERLITICSRSRHDAMPLHAPVTHKAQPVTLFDATRHLAPLDAKSNLKDGTDPLHRIPAWTDMQYFCMAHTPAGKTAFDNMRCVHCQHTSIHPSAVECESCHKQLPRPVLDARVWICAHCDTAHPASRDACECGHVRDSEAVVVRRRLIRAFKTSYRRMDAHRPASTLTTNSGVISSDVKGHPDQNRVLSLREVLIVASLLGYPGWNPSWTERVAAIVATLPDRLLREVAGESIPPRMMCALVSHLRHIDPYAPE